MNAVDYVLENLYRSREEVIAHPEQFEPEALERIDKAVAKQAAKHNADLSKMEQQHRRTMNR